VGYARRSFMVPFPRVRDFGQLNVMLEERCRERRNKTLRGCGALICERWKADQAAFQEQSAPAFEACD